MCAARPKDGTVGKALSVLDQVASFDRPARFTELQSGSAYPKATLYRFLQVLTNQGMLAYDPDRQTYGLGVRLVRLAHTAWSQSSLAPVARPFIDALFAEVGETVHLAQLDHAQVLYVDKRNSLEPIEMFSQAGRIGPAYCTGVGKVMLAYLPEEKLSPALAQQSYHRFTPNTLVDEFSLRAELKAIRERGHGYDREEHEPGIICVAAPILSRSGWVLGAISITSHTHRRSMDRLEAFLPALKTTATQIAGEVQIWRFPDDTNHLRPTGTE